MRAAIFVDAGYLFAQGSTALTGAKKDRFLLKLNEAEAVEQLRRTADAQSGGVPLLRIYWYDGASFKGPSAEQLALGHLDNVKLRLGAINSYGQQKGVDSLIVTDLIELGRNGAISDAILLSGDEDVRIGVQIAQSYGVRVHLIGIAPSRGSQAKSLLLEADTTTEWDCSVVAKFLTVVEPQSVSFEPPITVNVKDGSGTSATQMDPEIARIVISYARSLPPEDVQRLKDIFANQRAIPPEFDGKMIACGRTALGRLLTRQELQAVRHLFIKEIKSNSTS